MRTTRHNVHTLWSWEEDSERSVTTGGHRAGHLEDVGTGDS